MEDRSQHTDRIGQYRQPMVTATGIFLGVMLNFTSGWIKDAFVKYTFRDIVIAIGILVCLFTLVLALFRMLRMNYPARPDQFYRRTLRLFLVGISVPFFAFLIVIIHKIGGDRFLECQIVETGETNIFNSYLLKIKT